MATVLFVGNLSDETTEDDLRSLFTQVGTVNAVELIKDRDTGSFMGFAYVTMNSQEETNKAIYVFNGRRLDNRELRINAARPHENNNDRNQEARNQSSNSRSRSDDDHHYS